MPRRRVPAPKSNAMVFADASVCRQTGAAGWGAWVKRDGMGSGEVFGGQFKDLVHDSNTAEACALANALHRAISWQLVQRGDVVMLQSDSSAILARIRANPGGAIDSPARDGQSTGLARSRKPPPKKLRAALKQIAELKSSYDLVLIVRHVKGHRNKAANEGDGRAWVNRECDRAAKRHMRARRALIATAADPELEGAAA